MKCKIAISVLGVFVLVLAAIIILPGKICPIEKTDVICNEIMLQDYKNYFGRDLPENSKTASVFKDPQKYLIIAYSVNIKNNNFRTLFIEDYSLSIPKYDIVYFKNGMDFYSQYEYTPNEEGRIFGQAIIYTGDKDKKKVLDEVNKSMKINMWYWVHLNNYVSVLAFSKI